MLMLTLMPANIQSLSPLGICLAPVASYSIPQLVPRFASLRIRKVLRIARSNVLVIQ